MWNFGYSYNTANGKLMYRDFNMVISPLYPTVTGLFMKIVGNNMISFTLINTIYVLIAIYITYKINPKTFLVATPFVMISCLANYNTLCILFALLLIYLEKEKKNDYLIGFIIALAFLTKINVGVYLFIPSLYYFKDFKKILKRLAGFIIPNMVVVIIFLLLNNLKNYISYVFLGILDFASNNFQFSNMVYILALMLIYLIYLFIRERKICYLYAIFFMAMIYPVMNELHVMMASVPALVVMFDKNEYYVHMIRYLSFFCLAIPVFGLIINYKNMNFGHDNGLFKYRPIQNEYLKNKNDLYNHFKGNFDNVYFLTYDNYLYKLMLDLPINKYDVTLYGNLGYKGTEKMIKYLKTIEDDNYFVVDTVIKGAQYNYNISGYIRENCSIEVMVGNFYVLKKK